MSKIIELRNKRNTLWEQTKAFLEEHRDERGLVEASAVEQYNKMASDVKALGDEIKRLEDQAEMDAKLSAPTSAPIHHEPMVGSKKRVPATATQEYSAAFWNMMRGVNTMEVRDALSVGVDQNGGFTVSRAASDPGPGGEQHLPYPGKDHSYQLRYPYYPDRH